MRITERDIRMLRDLTLSHVLARDSFLELGYFSSVTRVNSRLRALRSAGLVKRLDTTFFDQSLYIADRKAGQIIGEKVSHLLQHRQASPRYLQHALAVTNTRIALVRKGASAWRFEQQVSHGFSFAGRSLQVRPDGLVIVAKGLVAIEVDLGHVAPEKFAEKLRAYDAFVVSGECNRLWNHPSFSLLTMTTGSVRASRLARLVPADAQYTFECRTFDQLGISSPGSWS